VTASLRSLRTIGVRVLVACVASGCALLAVGSGTGPVPSPDPLLRQVRAAHIMYSPNHDPRAAKDLPLSDPAWAVAEAAADRAAASLRAISDPVARETVFAALATKESDDDGSAQQGGDLGAITRGDMVESFGDPLFDLESPRPGDIIGPVRTDFGWHVIMYEGEGGTGRD